MIIATAIERCAAMIHMQHVNLMYHVTERYVSECPDSNGDYLSTTHLIYPRIEGILRSSMRTESEGPASQDSMATHAGQALSHLPHSLLLPRHFVRYLKEVYFAHFDPDDPAARVSRNTIGHGVASPAECNEKAAVIGLLILRHLSLCVRKITDEST